jgi:hypothetical protein
MQIKHYVVPQMKTFCTQRMHQCRSTNDRKEHSRLCQLEYVKNRRCRKLQSRRQVHNARRTRKVRRYPHYQPNRVLRPSPPSRTPRLLKACKERGIVFRSHSSLVQSCLTGKYISANPPPKEYRFSSYDMKDIEPVNELLKQIADTRDLSISAVALTYTCARALRRLRESGSQSKRSRIVRRWGGG